MNTAFNPEFNPTGIEGGLDTNAVPWIDIPQAPGMSFKPLRASSESGMFSALVRIRQGVDLGTIVHLGAMDLMVLSGRMRYTQASLAATLQPGAWGYIPANTRVQGLHVEQDVELLANFFGPLAFIGSNGVVRSVLTSLDVQLAARANGLTLVPNTLAECMAPRAAGALPTTQSSMRPGTAGSAATPHCVATAQVVAATAPLRHPHFVDTHAIQFFVDPAMPDIGLKVLRVSEETGVVSLIVRHNGVAGPHYHLGAADFLILSGRIGYRAGPPQGYGPGVWFFEPAGARHDATQRLGEDDLIYTANVYGPVQFDQGRNTPITSVLSWMQYKAIADANGFTLVRNVFPGDASLLAWAPLG